VNPDGYHYSRFCELYESWWKKRDGVCGKNTKPTRKRSPIGRVRRVLYATAPAALCDKLRYSQLPSELVPALGPEPLATSRWICAARPHARLRFFGPIFRRSPFQTTPGRAWPKSDASPPMRWIVAALRNRKFFSFGSLRLQPARVGCLCPGHRSLAMAPLGETERRTSWRSAKAAIKQLSGSVFLTAYYAVARTIGDPTCRGRHS